MRVKAKISSQSCPVKKWIRTSVLDKPDIVPKEFIKEVKEIWKDIEGKRAKDHKSKARLIELHNAIYRTNFNPDTNCGSCLTSVYKGIAAIHKQYIENE